MIDDNRQSSDEKMKKYYSKLDKRYSQVDTTTAMINHRIYQNHNSNDLTENIDPT